jgi:hypothetical protein
MSFGLASGDPNGIRTRVTAVKGQQHLLLINHLIDGVPIKCQYLRRGHQKEKQARRDGGMALRTLD